MEEFKTVEFVTINLDSLVEDIKDALRKQGFIGITWDGDRGGEYITGRRFNDDDFESNFTLEIPPLKGEGDLEEFHEDEWKGRYKSWEEFLEKF